MIVAVELCVGVTLTEVGDIPTEKSAAGRLIVYTAFNTGLSAYPLSAAMAIMVSDILTMIVPVYFVELTVGIDPSVV